MLMSELAELFNSNSVKTSKKVHETTLESSFFVFNATQLRVHATKRKVVGSVFSDM
ncbi:hypothetical protein SAMN05720606_111133 [Paenibacillus polysaccharolyticus]|uniref:Uncharacterized protein n=1 Tax=Paenibacillus polysaccharolyticus TaxID=582692 RepID=A0A1G5JKL2_9BACL|nr:hypothetical protein SAMN05720606_111133 [Paenibacillus polysaccharolyticus]